VGLLVFFLGFENPDPMDHRVKIKILAHLLSKRLNFLNIYYSLNIPVKGKNSSMYLIPQPPKKGKHKLKINVQ
jgi:hypothetical protein